MRRLTRAGLVLALLAVCASSGQAQQVPTRSGGILDLVTASVSVTNTTVAGTLYSRTISPNLFSNFAQPIIGSGSLHLRLLGTLTTNQGAGAAGTINVGCNFGGAGASIALANGATPPQSLVAAPVTLDVYVANVNPAPSQPGAQLVLGRLAVLGASATETVFNAAFVGNADEAINETLTCQWMWGSAATTNSVIFWNAIVHVGI